MNFILSIIWKCSFILKEPTVSQDPSLNLMIVWKFERPNNYRSYLYFSVVRCVCVSVSASFFLSRISMTQLRLSSNRSRPIDRAFLQSSSYNSYGIRHENICTMQKYKTTFSIRTRFISCKIYKTATLPSDRCAHYLRVEIFASRHFENCSLLKFKEDLHCRLEKY